MWSEASGLLDCRPMTSIPWFTEGKQSNAGTGLAGVTGTAAYGLLLVTIVLLPMVLDWRGLRPFLPAKESLLTAGAALAFVLLSGEALLRRMLPLPAANSAVGIARQINGRLWIGAAAVFVWWAAAAAYAAVNPGLHGLGIIFHGSQMGLYAWVVLILALPSPVQAARRRRTIVHCLGVSGAVVALHAYLQALGLDPLQWAVQGPLLAEGRWRLFSALGNPNWTAHYLALTAPLTAAWAGEQVSVKYPTWQSLGRALVWVLYAFVIAAAGSRLALFAWAVSFAMTYGGHLRALRAVLPRRWRPKPRVGKAFLVPFAVLTLIAITAAAILPGPAELAGRLLHRGSIAGRIHLYAAAVPLIRDAPMTGWGLEHAPLMLPQGLKEAVSPWGLVPGAFVSQLAQHIYCEWLELAVETGLVGAGLFLLLFVAALHAAQARRSRGQPGTSMQTPLRSVLAAFAVLTLGSAPLHTPFTAAVFWICLGLVTVQFHREKAVPAATGHGRGPEKPRKSMCLTLAVAMLLLASLLLFAGALRHGQAGLQANRLAYTGVVHGQRQQPQEAAEALRRALALAPWDHEAARQLAVIEAQSGNPEEALRFLAMGERYAPSRGSWLLRAELLQQLGQADEALEVLKEATAVLPDFLRAWLAAGELWEQRGNYPEAEQAYRRILASPQQLPLAEEVKAEAADRLRHLSLLL